MWFIGKYGILIIISIVLIIVGIVLIIKYVLSCKRSDMEDLSQNNDENLSCPNCGMYISAEAAYCRKCGTRINHTNNNTSQTVTSTNSTVPLYRLIIGICLVVIGLAVTIIPVIVNVIVD